MYRGRFRLGDKVLPTSPRYKGEAYVVTAVHESADISTNTYKLTKLDGGESIDTTGEFLEIVSPPDTPTDFSKRFLPPSIDLDKVNPKFRVGDVVGCGDESFVVVEAFVADNKDNKLVDNVTYELTPLGDESSRSYYPESALKFQYHDNRWDSYYNESVHNGLPAWRGELYNNYSFTSPDTIDDVRGIKTGYEDDTLPPIQMAHILKGHSIYSRMREMINGGDFQSRQSYRRSIITDLDISEDKMNSLYASIRQKILARNRTGTSSGYKENAKSNKIPKFTADEYEFIQEIDRIDQDDHYPVDMTNLQIMDAIKEAYEGAQKSGKRTFPSGEKDEKSLPAPNNGKMLYRGRSRKYDLIIEFWYNFDLDIIETAYPLRKGQTRDY